MEETILKENVIRLEGDIKKVETSYSPENARYQAERLEVLNKHFLEMIQKKEIVSGSYCLTRDNKIFADIAMGRLSFDVKDERPFKPDTIFRIASVTKLFTAVAILKLFEDGRIRLDQSVGEFLEEFNAPPYNKINIAHLLTHTSGLIEDQGAHENKYYQKWWESLKEDEGEKWVEAVLKKGMPNDLGKEWAYSTVGYMILGEVITRVSGIFCNDYIQKFIIDPCEMIDTSFGVRKEFAERYNSPTPWSLKDIEKLRNGEENEKEKEKSVWDKIPQTGGGIYSTCRDLTKFGTMLLNNGIYNGKRVIGRKALETMRKVHTHPEVKSYCWGDTGAPHPYGLGTEIIQENCLSQLVTPGTICHEGFGTCCLMIDFKENFVAAWSSQFYEGDWYAHALRNVASIIWSGLE
jgi:serine-type D-Ala-D-Ala carboxypeptidase